MFGGPCAARAWWSCAARALALAPAISRAPRPSRASHHDSRAPLLTRCAVRCRHYHASLSGEERECVQRDWSSDRVQVIVATIAFGMGQ